MDWLAMEQRRHDKQQYRRERWAAVKRTLLPWIAFAMAVSVWLNYLPIGAK